MDMMCNFLPGDPRLVEQIVKELKSQGIFDQFRKECISDVDTKPAYQNLRQRVEGSVLSFLKEQTWNPDMNKNQVREMLRKHIHESGFLETGVERIVDQVVNPKINSVFLPKVDDVTYKFLGIERPKDKTFSLENNSVQDLLPKDLEAISPEVPEEKKFIKEEINEIKMTDTSSEIKRETILLEENSIDSQSSVLSGIVSHDSNNSLKQDSAMSLNSSESRMSPSENNLKIELEDTSLSHKSSDSNSKTELICDGKINSENKEDNANQTEESSEKSSEEAKSKSKDKRREKHHSSDRSKSRSDKEKDKSKSDKSKRDEKDGKTEEKKYKIPKISDKNKDNKSRDKEDKSRDKEDKSKSDKVKSDKDSRSDKDKKYDKDRKSKHSSDRDNSISDKSKKERSERKDKDDKRDKKESSKSEKSRDDKRSSSSRKRDSSSKDNRKEKEKDNSTKNSKEETSEKSKNGHSSSSSRKDSKSRKDEDKSKSSHKKDDKEDRKRKRRSRDDHNSSKEKRSGGRSSDRDSDGPSSTKRLHTTSSSSYQTGGSDYLSQQTNQESSGLNSEGSSGYSGNSDKTEDKQEVTCNALLEMQKIKVPKFASNLNEAMKIMKIRKLLKKLDGLIKTNSNNQEVQHLLKEIETLSEDVKRDKKEQKDAEEKEKTEENQGTETSKAASINLDEFISSSNISMDKWTALEAKFMEQITNVDYNSYESPYVEDEEVSPVKTTNKSFVGSGEKTEEVIDVSDCEESITYKSRIVPEEPESEDNEKSSINSAAKDASIKIEKDSAEIPLEQKVLNTSHVRNISEVTTVSEPTNSLEVNISGSEEVVATSQVDNLNTRTFKDFKQRAIVLIHKNALTEKMIKKKNKPEDGTDSATTNIDECSSIFETEKENIGFNTKKNQLDVDNSGNNSNYYDESINDKAKMQSGKTVGESRNFEETLVKDFTENNLVVEESISQDIDVPDNSCEVCLDSKGDLCKGLEPSENISQINFLQCIINILEKEILKSKQSYDRYIIMKQGQYKQQTRKRKVNEKNKEISNNNVDTSASKLPEDEDTKLNPGSLSPSKKIHPHTNSKMTTASSYTTQNKHLGLMNADNQSSEIKSRRQSGVKNDPTRTNSEVNTKPSNKSVDGSTEKKNRNNQRYSSEDLYKPRIHLRRSGRDSKNP
ncbi:biorientation of chromosomes in cell division protein 1-like 1 [Harmonia axyridis]|uniref:biorientation of chromosomes in cell division protein 1-like 1 n=1 Tax=Harmonia axyridis TaxID=115357 RepID=UPI001E2789EA|nr:biorientation of chromosomes in cell division protein 1-like 1 [Harmonia axyridis]